MPKACRTPRTTTKTGKQPFPLRPLLAAPAGNPNQNSMVYATMLFLCISAALRGEYSPALILVGHGDFVGNGADIGLALRGLVKLLFGARQQLRVAHDLQAE